MRFVRVFVVTRLAFTFAALFLAILMAEDAPKPIKLTDAEKLKVRDAQVEVLQVQTNMKQLEDIYRNLQEQLKTAQPALDKILADIKRDHGCPNCDLDKDANLVPPPVKPDSKESEKK